MKTFIEKITPHTQALMACQPQPAEVGIWKSRKNEIFHFAMHGGFDSLVDSLDGYIQTLYQLNIPYRFISGAMLEQGDLDGLKLLILPAPYLLSEPEAARLDAWVQQGGVVMVEAHLAGYNATTGRHARVLPGCGLAEAWGLREADTTSSYHLHTGALAGMREAQLEDPAIPEDVRKALADSAVSGGLYFPIQLASGQAAWGAERYAQLDCPDGQPEGWFEPGKPCMVSKAVGTGAVFYAATHLGQGAKKDAGGLIAWLQKALERAGVRPAAGLKGEELIPVKIDLIASSGSPRYLVIHNRSDREQIIQMDPLPDGVANKVGVGIFTGMKLPLSQGVPLHLPGGFIDIIAYSSGGWKI